MGGKVLPIIFILLVRGIDRRYGRKPLPTLPTDDALSLLSLREKRRVSLERVLMR